MDFFGAQREAQRASRSLLLIFAASVIAIVGCLYLATAASLRLLDNTRGFSEPLVYWDPMLFLIHAVVVGGFILLVSAYHVSLLNREGGAAILEGLGGRRVPRSTTEPKQRQLINIVDEMAIAAGIPSVPVFVLEEENCINALAAGPEINRATLGLTQGALDHLSRDELQAVVAHEFSHILHGDMQVNFRLTGLLRGILLIHIIGGFLMRAGQKVLIQDRKDGLAVLGVVALPVFVIGLFIRVAGFIGHVFSDLIKAATSRQREYLADASAVQFTRNAESVTSALKKIARVGAFIRHPAAEAASHMFIESGKTQWATFASHPPLAKRIQRIDPSFDEASLPRLAPYIPPEFADEATDPVTYAQTAGVGASTPDPARLAALPATLTTAAHHIDGAQQIIYALLLAGEPAMRTRQLEAITLAHPVDFREQVITRANQISDHDTQRLVLLDLALPTLSELPLGQRRQFLACCHKLIHADGAVSLFEQVLLRLLRACLFRQSPARGMTSTERAQRAASAVLLSAVSACSRITAPDTPVAAETDSSAAGLQIATDATLPNAGELNDALDLLANARPSLREELIESCIELVLQDGKVNASEAELLRAISQALGCPIPPTLRYADSLVNPPPAVG